VENPIYATSVKVYLVNAKFVTSIILLMIWKMDFVTIAMRVINMDKDFIKFIEDYGGIELTAYQKIYLKALASKEDMIINARVGYKKLINNLMIEYRKKMKMDFDLVTRGGIERYRGGELVNVEKYNR